MMDIVFRIPLVIPYHLALYHALILAYDTVIFSNLKEIKYSRKIIARADVIVTRLTVPDDTNITYIGGRDGFAQRLIRGYIVYPKSVVSLVKNPE